MLLRSMKLWTSNMREYIFVLFFAVGCLAKSAPKLEDLRTDHNIPSYVSRFLIVGDYGSTSRSAANRVASEMNRWAASNGADFILSTGDNFYQDGPPSVNSYLFNERWADVYTGSYIRNLVWFMSVGNHDYYPYEGYEWNEVMRTYATGERKWYLPWLWYNVTMNTPAGKLDLIVADSQAARKNMNDRSQMYSWLDATLRWSRDSGHNSIVVSHHPGWSAGNYYPGSSTVRNNILNRARSYGASVFISGHDHNLQHLTYTDGRSPEMLIIGGGGAGLYGQDSSASSGLGREGVKINYFARTYGFVGVRISSNNFYFDYYDDYGRYLGHSAIIPKK